MSNEKVTYIDGYPVARVEDFGFKEHKFLKKFWKILSTVLVCLIIFSIYLSTIIILIQSFNSSVEVNEFTGFTFKWYGEIFKNRSLLTSIKNTFIVSLSATAISTVIGILVAIGIFYLPRKFQRKLILLNNIPLLNADIVTGISIMLIFSVVMKIPGFTYIFGFPTMLLAHVYFCLPYVILNVIPKLKELDPNMMDAALDLGLKPRKALLKVIVPAIKGGILAGLVFAFTMSFDDFVVSYYTTGNGFNNFSIWIYGSIGRKSLTPAAYAFSSLITFGSMIVLLAIYFITRKKGAKKHGKK